MKELPLANESGDPTNSLVVKGIYYYFDGDLYFPSPLDLVEPKEKHSDSERNKDLIEEEMEENKYNTKVLRLLDSTKIASNSAYPYLLYFDQPYKIVEKGAITEKRFNKYLNGVVEDYEIRKIEQLTIKEHKIGIGRNNALHASEEGNLYRLAMTRLKPSLKSSEELRFYVVFEFADEDSAIRQKKEQTLTKGILRLGGEGKIVNLRQKKHNIDIKLKNLESNHFKLYLSSPAIFKEGNSPDLTQYFKQHGIEIEIISAVVGKPIRIGGFDMKTKSPKVMQLGTPAGSVYYCHITSQHTLADVQNIIVQNNIYSISDYRKKEGFGLFLLANLDFKALKIS